MRHRTMGLALILASCAASLVFASQAHAQDAFTIETSPAPTPGQLIPKLTWETSPAGATCVGSGDWSGAKAGSGTETLAARAAPFNYAMRCDWPGGGTTTLSWVAPTTNTDGSALAKCPTATDTGPCLAKFRICRGTTATALTDCRDHNFPASTSTPWSGTLAVGTHWFGVQAVAGNGAQSAMSNTASKTITAPKVFTASVGVKLPSPATGFNVE
jgi:hypothetical protein